MEEVHTRHSMVEELARVAQEPQPGPLVELIERLVATFQPDRVYLFGSQARGDATEDSDYDLLVVLPQADEPGYRLSQRAHSLIWGMGISADILVWTRDAFDRRLHIKASLPATVVREGILLYAA